MGTYIQPATKSLSDLVKPLRISSNCPAAQAILCRRKSFVNDNNCKNQNSFNSQMLNVQNSTRNAVSETNLISEKYTNELNENIERTILSPIIPDYLKSRLVNRRISVSKTKLSPPFIKTASYMIQTGRVSFQDLVICVLHCLQHLTGTRGKVLAPNDDISVKQICYEIAFNVLKYRTVLVDVMEQAQFFSTFPHLYDINQLVTILTYIQYILAEPLPKDNVYNSEIRTILRALFVHKIHIDASFARSRIKFNAATVIHLLPKEDREEYVESTKIDENAPPYYCRVNRVKNNINDVIGALQQNFTFFPVQPDPNLNNNPGFYRDSTFKDLLVFSSNLREELTGLPIVKESGLVLQERVLSYVVTSLQGLMVRGYDIIQTHAGSGSLATYLGSVLEGNKCKLRVCGCSPGDIPHIQHIATKQGIKYVDLSSIPFLNYGIPEKPQVQAIVCTPPSTMSAIKEPFRYALYEGDYSVAGEKVKKQQTSLRQFVSHQTKTLRQALSYPKISTIVYFTLSTNFQENEGVVRNCLEEFNEKCENPAHRFSPIPVLPSVRKEMLDNRDPTAEKPSTKEFYKTIEPDAGYAGCFITVLYRKMPEDVSKTAATEETNCTNFTSTSSYVRSGGNNSSSISSYTNTYSNRAAERASGYDQITSSISFGNIPNQLSQPKKKKKGHPKVISMDDSSPPIIGDFSKLGLIEKTPSLQAFKKDFIQSYEMVMGPGSRAKFSKMKQIVKPKKVEEPVFPKVSLVVTKAMEQRKREKVKPQIIHQQVIVHPHPFK